MVQLNLPIINQDGKEDVLRCDLDSSLACEERWEEKFPKLAERSSLMDFIKFLSDKNEEEGVMPITRILSSLKAIYCTIDFSNAKKELTFKEFLQLFTFNDPAYTKKVTDTLSEAIGLLYPQSKKKD